MRVIHGGTTFHNVSVLPSGKFVSSGSLRLKGAEHGTLRIWDPETGVCERSLIGHQGSVERIVVLPSGKFMSGSFDRTLRLWDPEVRLDGIRTLS